MWGTIKHMKYLLCMACMKYGGSFTSSDASHYGKSQYEVMHGNLEITT